MMRTNYFFKHLIPVYRSFAKNGRVVAFDTETTGLTEKDEVVQIAAIEYVNGKQTRTFTAYLRPSIPLNPEAGAVNGLTDDFLKENGEAPKEVLEKFVEFVGENCLLVAHNLPFDLRMIQQGFKKYEVSGPGNKVLGCDTRNFVKEMNYPGIPSHHLRVCVDYFALDAKNSHEALDDADACGKLFFKLVNDEDK